MKIAGIPSLFASNRAGLSRLPFAALVAGLALFFAGCETAPPPVPTTKVAPGVQKLVSGDVIKIQFPGAANLDNQQEIRRDGKINLQLIGEITAIDKTPAELEKDLAAAYDKQIVSKEVKVTVVSSQFSVFVTGAVMKPGKVQSNRELTAFDAIMEAGGFDESKADKKKVRIIRQENGKIESYPIDFKAVLGGKNNEPFYLKAYDTVYVPERTVWF
ncbi:MAG: polysaccharide export protein [Opitutaceae bacterium]|nr:polysaccharide export protein [Opitutaceae bacterium]